MNKKIIMGVIVIVLAGGFFYTGMMYGEQKNKVIENSLSQNRQGQLQQFSGRNGPGGQRGGAMRAGGGFITGEILSKDAQSITVKLRDGGSKIILVSESTRVTKETEGTIDDLSIGTGVSIAGETNSDGSINAQSVQIRQNIPSTRGNN